MGRGEGRKNSVLRKEGKLKGIMYSWKKIKDDFVTGVFGGGRMKVRGRGRRKSVQWEGEEEGGILYSGKRMRKEELFCTVGRRGRMKSVQGYLEEVAGR